MGAPSLAGALSISRRSPSASTTTSDPAGRDGSSAPVLLVADLLHPIDRLAVEPFLDGDMAHRRGRRRPVPMLLPRRKGDDVAGPDLLDRAALVLDPAAAGHHDQGLAERVSVPGGARARLEGDESAGDAGWIGRTQQRVDPDSAGKPLPRSLAGRLRPASLDLHHPLLWPQSSRRSRSSWRVI